MGKLVVGVVRILPLWAVLLLLLTRCFPIEPLLSNPHPQ
jgi:hypothetical protein